MLEALTLDEDIASRDIFFSSREGDETTGEPPPEEGKEGEAAQVQTQIVNPNVQIVNGRVTGVDQKPGVKLNQKMIDFLAAFRSRLPASIPILVTSAIRTPEEQAYALYTKRRLGDNLYKLYGQDRAAPIMAVPNDVNAMTAAIQKMMSRGVFMSQHMKANALDIRSRNWTGEQSRVVADVVRSLGAKYLFETKPPHLHITLPDSVPTYTPGAGQGAVSVSYAPSAGSGTAQPTAKGSWKGRLGSETARGINFHKMLDNRNNYRAGIKPKHTAISREFFQELRDVYGIQRVITLNDRNHAGQDIPTLVDAAGLTSYYVPMGENNMGTRRQLDKIKSILAQGNTLIHCTHGADRTGAVVGRYYVENLGWSVPNAIADAKKYGGYKSGPDFTNSRDFLDNGPSK